MSELRFIDSHAHFDTFAERGEVAALLETACAAGVQRVVAIGGTPAANRLAVDLSRRHAGSVRATVGYDRDEAGGSPDLAELEALAGQAGVVAVGETGLDYHYGPETATAQRALLEANLDVARRHGLPAVLHSREADEDTLALLQQHARAWTGDPARLGVLHCFTGSAGFARRLLDLGLHISFSGIVTFKNAADLREVARLVPDDRILIETDAPYLAPVPFRGRTNQPAWVVHVAAALATERNVSIQTLAEQTWINATRLFAWDGRAAG
jgi:TatD DNase family protein